MKAWSFVIRIVKSPKIPNPILKVSTSSNAVKLAWKEFALQKEKHHRSTSLLHFNILEPSHVSPLNEDCNFVAVTPHRKEVFLKMLTWYVCKRYFIKANCFKKSTVQHCRSTCPARQHYLVEFELQIACNFCFFFNCSYASKCWKTEKYDEHNSALRSSFFFAFSSLACQIWTKQALALFALKRNARPD